MRRLRASSLFAALLAIPFAASTVHAGDPHDRNGFFIGFGVGGGGAEIELKNGATGSEGAGVGTFRIGGAVTQQVTLGLESSSWIRKDSVGSVDVTTTLSAGTFGVTYFPSATQGLYLKGGVGFGQARVDAESGGGAATYDETGLALLAALGHEWRLTRKFALAPQAEVVFLGIDGTVVDRASWFDLTLQFSWYW